MRGWAGVVGEVRMVGGMARWVQSSVGVCLSSGPALAEPLPLCSVSRSPPSNLALASESPSSLRVSWTPPSGRVLHYRLTYALASGSGPEKSVGLGGAGSQHPLWAPGSWWQWGDMAHLSVEGASSSVVAHTDKKELSCLRDQRLSGGVAQVTWPSRSLFQDPRAT